MLKRLKGDDDSYNKQPVANAYACIDLGHRRGWLDQDRPRSSIKNPGLEVSPGSLDEKLGQEVWSELYQLKIEQPVDYLYESNTILKKKNLFWYLQVEWKQVWKRCIGWKITLGRMSTWGVHFKKVSHVVSKDLPYANCSDLWQANFWQQSKENIHASCSTTDCYYTCFFYEVICKFISRFIEISR